MGFFDTRITELFGIQYPIIQGGMAAGLVSTAELSAAVGNAGGIGFMCAIQWLDDVKGLEDEIKKAKDLTDKPFGINVTLFPMIDASWFDAVFELIAKYGVPAIETCAEEQVPAMEIGGVPLDRFEGGKYFKMLKDAGVKLFHKVGSVKHGKHAEEAGYDGVIAADVEEGGHPLNENVATTILTPRMSEELNIPVVTAGGMADGRGLAAALCLGAEGILMATRFINTTECKVHERVHQEIIRRQENETVLYGNTIGLQGRALLNDSIRKVMEIEARGGGLEEILPHISGQYGDHIWQEGKMDTGLIPVGQTIGLIHDVVSCKELLDRIVQEAEEVLSRNLGRFSKD